MTRKSSEKAQKTKVAFLGEGLNCPSGKFWVDRAEGRGVLSPVSFIVKNHGPNQRELPVAVLTTDGRWEHALVIGQRVLVRRA
jgi:hypothetical protein